MTELVYVSIEDGEEAAVTSSVECPDCDHLVELPNNKRGDVLDCLGCGAQLYIIQTSPEVEVEVLDFEPPDEGLGDLLD